MKILPCLICVLFTLFQKAYAQEDSLPRQEAAVQTDTTVENLSHAQLVALIDEFAADISANYIYPDIANQIVEKVHADIENGYYDNVTTADSLARLLYETTFAISQDRHFKVQSLAQIRAAYAENKPDRPDDFGANHGFREVKILPGNIGYVKLEALPGDDESLEAVRKEMAKVTSCDALIFDVRDNEGGSGDFVQLLCNYLFEANKHLYSFYDRHGKLNYEAITSPDFEGTRLSPAAPVYVLVGERTISAAESLAYVLKHHERATIVGDTTIGMAHPAQGFTAQNEIFYNIPFLRFEHPVTKTDWESVGVIPDIIADDEASLDVAVSEARKSLKREQD